MNTTQGGRPTERKRTKFGHVIARQLQKLGQTQSWLAEEGEWSNNCVTKWMYSPTRQIKDENLTILSRVLKVPERKLLDALPKASEKAETKLRGNGLIASVPAAKKPVRPTTKGDALVAPDGGSKGTMIDLIRSLMPKLSPEQQLKVLDKIIERGGLPNQVQKEVAQYMWNMLLDDGS